MKNMRYFVWIEAATWPEGWNVQDGNTEVVVYREDLTQWTALFLTYSNINSLVEKNKRTGECLDGKYFWASDMVLVDEVSRTRIEEVVSHLITEGEFESVFKQFH